MLKLNVLKMFVVLGNSDKNHNVSIIKMKFHFGNAVVVFYVGNRDTNNNTF